MFSENGPGIEWIFTKDDILPNLYNNVECRVFSGGEWKILISDRLWNNQTFRGSRGLIPSKILEKHPIVVILKHLLGIWLDGVFCLLTEQNWSNKAWFCSLAISVSTREIIAISRNICSISVNKHWSNPRLLVSWVLSNKFSWIFLSVKNAVLAVVLDRIGRERKHDFVQAMHFWQMWMKERLQK